MSKKLLQAAAGNAGEALYVEDVFSTYLYEGLTNWNIRQEITTSAKTNNHFVILSILGNNLGSGNNSGSNENEISNADFLIQTNNAGGSADGTNSRRLSSLHYNSSSSGEYIGRTLDAVDSTGEYFGYAATFNYGDATSVTEVNVYSNFDFTSSGSDIQSGDLLLFVSMDSASATQSTLPAGFTEIFYNNQSGTYGFAIRAAAKIADGTENGTDFGDNALLSASSFEQGIILRKTGGSWDISEMVSSLAEETNTLESGSKIINGIDLSGEGGLTWLKIRPVATSHVLVDTERGTNSAIFSDLTNSEQTGYPYVTSFNSDGFALGNMSATNDSSYNYTSWTFRKAEKFFDVVTYTGDGTSNRQVPHNLGSVPGCIILKRYDTADDWKVYHVGADATAPEDYVLELNSTSARLDSISAWNDTAPTDSNFTVNSGGSYNASGGSYVAYLFAHDAGGFGDDGSESIIKCGSYTTDGSGDATVDLGFEPQMVISKSATITGDWFMFDNMRGMEATGANTAQKLAANSSNAETTSTTRYININATGFNSRMASNNTFIYIAIRRPMKTPESGTEVFDLGENRTSIGNQTIGTLGPIDMCMSTQVPTPYTNYHWAFTNRLVGGSKFLASAYTQAEATAYQEYDTNTGVINTSWFTNGGLWYNFKRATGFFDVVAYTGDGGTTQTLNHNLGVTPEFMIGKRRNDTQNWVVYHSSNGAGKYYNLNTTTGVSTLSTVWGGVAPTSTQFTVGNSTTVNFNGDSYITYLFATLAGVSKVGNYTGTGSNVDVDCGFSAGARFILIKRTDASGDWYVWDSERGIVADDDPYLLLNSTAAEVTNTDYIDPLSSGFTVTSSAPAALNASGGSYIFLAIA